MKDIGLGLSAYYIAAVYDLFQRETEIGYALTLSGALNLLERRETNIDSQ